MGNKFTILLKSCVYKTRRKYLLWKFLTEHFLSDFFLNNFQLLLCLFCSLIEVLFLFSSFFLVVNPEVLLFKLTISQPLLFFLFLLSIFFFFLFFLGCCLNRDKMPDANLLLRFLVVTFCFLFLFLCIFFGFWFLYTHVFTFSVLKVTIKIPKRFLYFLFLLFVLYLVVFSLRSIYLAVRYSALVLKTTDYLYSSTLTFFYSAGAFCFGILILTYFDFGVLSTESHFFFGFKCYKIYWSENQLLTFSHTYIVNTFEPEIAKRLFELLPELISQCENNITFLQEKIDVLAVKIQQELATVSVVSPNPRGAPTPLLILSDFFQASLVCVLAFIVYGVCS